MSATQDDFTHRRRPDYSALVCITGTRLGDTGKVYWTVEAEHISAPIEDEQTLAGMLEKCAAVLRG